MCCLACCPHQIPRLGLKVLNRVLGTHGVGCDSSGRERTTGECQGLSKNQALEVSPLQPCAQSVLQHLPWPCTFPESCSSLHLVGETLPKLPRGLWLRWEGRGPGQGETWGFHQHSQQMQRRVRACHEGAFPLGFCRP